MSNNELLNLNYCITLNFKRCLLVTGKIIINLNTTKITPMKSLLYSMVILLYCVDANAQCNTFFPIKEKVKYHFDFFDKKDKLSLRTTQTLKNVTGGGNSMKATMVQEMIDVKKDKLIGTSESDWTCDNGTLHFSVNNFAFGGDQQATMGEGMAMDVTGDQMDIPSSFEVGQTLKDLTYQIKMSVSGMTMMNRSYNVKDRKVESMESITTPAGTFDCYKISFTTTSQGGMGSGTMKSVVWYAKDVGMVKTENYNEKGNLIGRQVLSKIENL